MGVRVRHLAPPDLCYPDALRVTKPQRANVRLAYLAVHADAIPHASANQDGGARS